MKLLDLYKSMLSASGRVVENESYVSINNSLFTDSDKNDPLLIDGKRLVLPTYAQQSDPDRTNKIIFHPLSENILRGESIVVANLRSAFSIRINYSVAASISALLEVCSSINKHKTLSPDQAIILSLATNCDEDTNKVFNSMAIKCLGEENKFVKIYLKRSGVINNVKFSRAGIVSFPFYEELKEAKDSLYGIKFRKKDREIILSMMEYLFPKIKISEGYNAGSDSSIAPFTDALMKTVLNLASNLNDVFELFKDKLDGFDKLIFDSEWVEGFNDLNVFQNEIRLIPTQAGNEGESKKLEQPIVQANMINYTPPAPSLPTAGRSIAPPVNVPANSIPQLSLVPQTTSSGKVKLGDLMSRNPNLVYSQPQTPMPPSLMAELRQGGLAMPGIPPQYPQQPQQYPPQQQMSPEQYYQYQQWLLMQQQPQQFPQQYPPAMYQQPQMGGPGMPRSAGSMMPNNPIGMPPQGFYRNY